MPFEWKPDLTPMMAPHSRKNRLVIDLGLFSLRLQFAQIGRQQLSSTEIYR